MKFWKLRRKIHTSWLIALMSTGIVIGAAVVPTISQSFFGALVWLLVGSFLALFVLWRRAVYLLPLILAAGIIIGMWRGSLLDSQLVVYERLVGSTLQVSGKVSDDPDIGKDNETLLRLEDIVVDGHDVAGKVWVSMDHQDNIKRSDLVSVSGQMSEGFGNFSAAIFDANLVSLMRLEPGDAALTTRDWFAEQVRKGIEEPQASLGLGYLVGQRRSLPPELDTALVVAGLTHIVVASGYNLTILVRLARRLFVKVSKYLATLSASAMILGFMAVTGASPSMSRAGLVAGLSLAAWYYGRRFHPLVLLPFAGAITVLIDPSYAWNDLGWQLSFAAFAGVMVLAPLLQRCFFEDTKPGLIRQIMGETVSATIMTLPILVLAFGQFSNVSIFANVLILPLVPLAMLLTFIAGVGAALMPGLASFIGLPAQWLLTYMTSAAQFFANQPWALTIIEIQQWMVWLAYAGLATLCVYLWRATKYNLRDSNIIE